MVQTVIYSPNSLQEQIFGASNTASATDAADNDFESAQWTAYNQLATEGFPGDSDLDWGFVVSCWLASSGMTQHSWWHCVIIAASCLCGQPGVWSVASGSSPVPVVRPGS